MPDQAQLHELLQVSAFGGIGILLALALLVAGLIFLGRGERRLLRVPILLFALHVAIVAVELLLPDDPMIRRPVRVVAIAVLLLSIGRTGFLLLVHAITGRRGQVPLPRIFQDMLQGLIYCAVVLVVLRASGVELASLLTTSALLTAVIGLSLQETLGNLFAGLAIQAQRPFEIGDWIQFDADPAHVGRVVEINWRATRVLTIDNVEVIVPNGAIARASIRNYSKPSPEVRRGVTIVVGSEVPPGDVHRVLLAAVAGTEGVLEQPPPDAQTIGFTERGVEYRVRFWSAQLDRREPVDGAVRDRLWYALQRAGYPLPAAQRHVVLQEQTDAARVQDQERATTQRERTLRFVDFFRDLPADVVRALAQTAKRRMYGEGEVVIQEGSEGDELFVVEEGEVEVLVGGREREAVRVATLGASRFFGEMSLMTGERRRATVKTVRPSVLLVVGKSDLQPVLESHAPLAQKISSLLAERDVALGQVQLPPNMDRKSMVELQSSALLGKIRHFFSL